MSRYIELRKTNGAQVAKMAGYDKGQLTKWRQGASVSPKLARDTALALNAPVLEAFIAAGFLTVDDASQIVEIDRPLRHRDDDEILREVGRRMKGHSLKKSDPDPLDGLDQWRRDGDDDDVSDAG